ncbi:ferritin-like domain-containing protein, partial [Streptomyces sp. NPDC056405]|uniref:ferritin-like domain-containing protein n=1 Tax=Streptomyces sp. NPDC056405 TaxID=3345811 RepID=UPI0035DD05A3
MTTSSKPTSSQPWLHQKGSVIQEFGTVKQFPIALSYEARMYSSQRLNKVLANTRVLYGLYKKHHWSMRGATFYQLHLLLDKHAGEQLAAALPEVAVVDDRLDRDAVRAG